MSVSIGNIQTTITLSAAECSTLIHKDQHSDPAETGRAQISNVTVP